MKLVRRSGHISLNMWGCVGGFGPGILLPVSSTFNSEEYVECLEFFFLPSLRMMGLYPPEDGRPLRLVQDNCAVHRARIVQEWFRDHQIEVMFWPSYSPDLNIIENVWARMANNWEKEDERTTEALYAHATREWESYRGDGEYFRKLASSMITRIAMVREAQGGHTKN